MDEHIYPAEAVYHAEVEANRRAGNAWQPTRVMEDLKAERAAGLEPGLAGNTATASTAWNTRRCAEIMGRSHVAPEAFNCSAPDGNMTLEVLRHARAATALAAAAAGRQDPLGLRHDRQGERLVGRHQHQAHTRRMTANT